MSIHLLGGKDKRLRNARGLWRSEVTRSLRPARSVDSGVSEKERFIVDNLLVQIRFIIVMIRWTGLAP